LVSQNNFSLKAENRCRFSAFFVHFTEGVSPNLMLSL
jgi:hypothetical protein